MKIRLIPLLIISAMFMTTAVSAEKLIIPGTGANENLLKKISKVFNARNPGHEVSIPPSIGSGGGIHAIINDKFVVVRIARDLKPAEAAHGLKQLVFAKNISIFGLTPYAGVKSLTSAQLIDIFTGRIENWQQVGGKDAYIRVLTRGLGDSTLDNMIKQIKEFDGIEYAQGSKIVYHDYEMVEMLKKYKSAIGLLPKSAIVGSENLIIPVNINNISPTADNVLNGKYRATGKFSFVFKGSAPKGLAGKFISFVFSDTGKSIMKEYGVIPVERQ